MIDLADSLSGVDAVIGDHTDFQAITTRPNGALVIENRSKGIRFTRLRLVVDMATRTIVYKAADFHRPWTIGVTPDPEILADHIVATTPISPSIQGRIVCTSSGATPCPVVTP